MFCDGSPRYQVSVNRTIGHLVYYCSQMLTRILPEVKEKTQKRQKVKCQLHWIALTDVKRIAKRGKRLFSGESRLRGGQGLSSKFYGSLNIP